MPIRDRIGTGLARAALAVAGRVGVEISFSHRGAATVTLKAQVLTDRIEILREGMFDAERRVVTFAVPTQTNFVYSSSEGEPVTPGDKVTFNAREHFVLDPVEKDDTGRLYMLRCVEQKRLKQG